MSVSPPRPPALLIVDVQKGFLAPAYAPFTANVPARVEALQAAYDIVFATRFVNAPASPHRRFLGWDKFAPGSMDTELAFAPKPGARVIEKSLYTCVDAAFLKTLADLNVTQAHVCGIATDNCVLKCAADLFEAGVEPVVLTHACASHGGTEAHAAGLKVLARLIGPERVRGGG